MNAEAMRQMLNVRPFEPMEAVLSSGQTFAIECPENVMLTKSRLVVAYPETDGVLWTSLIHVVGLRRRQSTTPAS